MAGSQGQAEKPRLIPRAVGKQASSVAQVSNSFQPAVSPISNRQPCESFSAIHYFEDFAGWKPCDTADWKSALLRRSGLGVQSAKSSIEEFSPLRKGKGSG